MFFPPPLWVTVLGFSSTYWPPFPFDNYIAKNNADHDDWLCHSVCLARGGKIRGSDSSLWVRWKTRHLTQLSSPRSSFINPEIPFLHVMVVSAFRLKMQMTKGICPMVIWGPIHVESKEAIIKYVYSVLKWLSKNIWHEWSIVLLVY